MLQIDASLTRLINGWSGGGGLVDFAMVALSSWGVQAMVLAVALQWWRRDPARPARHMLVVTGLAFLIGLGLNQLILLDLHRIRPYAAGVTTLIVSPSADYSFPSDHATASMAIAAAMLLQGLRRQGAVMLTAALLIALSRVYIGIHYAGDVLGGALTGLAGALAARALYPAGSRLDRFITGIL